VNHAREIIEIPCEQIRIGERHRKEMGDLEALAESIATEGLLQPIGITEDGELVFGQRRLLAVRDYLKWPQIPARVVRVSSIVAGEYVENELRKAFTPSERAAIGAAVEAQLGERRGRHNVDNCPQFHGTKTRELAARKAGFESYKTCERAKKVTELGAPELVAAMDAGELSIGAAAVIAQEPAEAIALLKPEGELA